MDFASHTPAPADEAPGLPIDPRPLSPDMDVEQAVRSTIAVLAAIEAGGLLSALPQSPADADRHNTAVELLGLLHDRLVSSQRAAA